MTGIAAARIWYAVSPSGEAGDLVLRVSVPREYPDMGWGCSVSLGLLEPLAVTIYGVDSWQAMREAMLFMARRIRDFADNGWMFYWEKDGDLADASELAYDPKSF